MINDFVGTGRVQNVDISEIGEFFVVGEVEEFDFAKSDADNEAAEFLGWYGEGFWKRREGGGGEQRRRVHGTSLGVHNIGMDLGWETDRSGGEAEGSAN